MAKKNMRAPKRYRQRHESLTLDKEQLGNYLVECLDRDLQDRSEWNDMRLQRYAKLRGWREPKDYPWQDASNAHLPFLMTECLRQQDTIHNAVLARHPVCESSAILKVNQEKQSEIDNLIDYQVFDEQEGEEIISALTQQFVQDGVFCAYIPWVRYNETVQDIRIFNPVPPELSIDEAVMNGVMQVFSDVVGAERLDEDGFRWRITYQEGEETKDCTVEAFIHQEGGRLELSFLKSVRAYDGPKIMPKEIEDWVAPWRAANPQPPSPSNPEGADHFILLDYPKVDEVLRLYEDGYYDSLTDEDLDELRNAATYAPQKGEENDSLKQIKDDFEGTQKDASVDAPEEVTSNKALTRMCCFLGWDVNGDGLEEQVVVWMIKETKQILRVRYLTEDYPADPPLRPVVVRGMLPIGGRIYSMGLIELLESLHDIMKMTFDQMVDSATIRNMPWGAYRPMSGISPETFRPAPGEFFPMSNPQQDLFLPQWPSQSDSYGLNMLTVLSQLAERASLQGDIQFGRVPQGKASALRTASGMAAIMAKGDARPERILRRFFSGLADIWQIIHELNQRFLPVKKQYQLIEPDKHGKTVYAKIDNIENISGRMKFKFKAGIFNTDKQMAQEVLQTLMQVLINPMTLQMGVVTPQQVHNLLTDFIKLLQQEPTRYLVSPPEQDQKYIITAGEAIGWLNMGRLPVNTAPAEGPEQHLKIIMQWARQPENELLSEHIKQTVNAYLTQLNVQLQQQQQQQQLLQAAQQFNQAVGPQGRPGPQGGLMPNTGMSGNPPMGQNELLNESLPSAR